MTNELNVINNDGKLYLDSRDVAKMVGKEHKHLLRDIRGYLEILQKSDINKSKFFINSTYINSQNKVLPCFFVTKNGCELIINRMRNDNINKKYFINFFNNLFGSKIKTIVINERMEKMFFDKLDDFLKPFNYTLERQKPVLQYYIDGYIKELNISIEYDEEHHRYNKCNDVIREKEIINELKCEFIRVKKGYELDGLKNIIEKINKLKNNKYYLKNKFKIKGDNKDEK